MAAPELNTNIVIPAPKQNATIVEKAERQVRMMSDRLVRQTMELRRATGDRPAFTRKLTDKQVARRYWFEWFTYANAAPEIAKPYAEYELNLHGPKAVLQKDREMRRMSEDWDLVEEALKFAPLKQMEDYQMMRAANLHNGQIQPTAKDTGWKPPKDHRDKMSKKGDDPYGAD